MDGGGPAGSIGLWPNDQRGYGRSFNGLPDIGAIELQLFLVTNTLDSGAGSLREAISSANSRSSVKLFTATGAGFDTIRFETGSN